MPVRIQLSRAKGWRMPPNTVKVDRSTKWGNPFVVGSRQTPAQAVAAFRRMVEDYPHGLDVEVRQLRGKNLACWCALDKPCHADVLLELANG
jgi:hypothetical protein